MTLKPTWNRRTFVTALGLTGAASALPAAAQPLPAAGAPAPQPGAPAFAFVSEANSLQANLGCVRTLRVEHGRWTEMHSPFQTSTRAEALAIHPTLPTLYTAHGSQGSSGLPRGQVEALRIDPSSAPVLGSGRHALNKLNHQPLALSSQNPRHLAVSPDGRSLLVTDFDSGILNLLPLASDGSILPLEHVLKQTGSGPHRLQTSARTHSVLFHPEGRLAYTTDLGADRLNAISFEDPQPRVVSRLSFAGGTGPAHMVLHPAGGMLLVSNHLRPGVTAVPLMTDGTLMTSQHHHELAGERGGPLALSPSGDRLYVAASRHASGKPQTLLSTFRLTSSGRLSLLQTATVPGIGSPGQLILHGSHLFVLGSGGLATIALAARTGLADDAIHSIRGGDFTGLVLRKA